MKQPVVAIVGVGLIGASIGLALRARKKASRIIGIGRRPTSLRKAKQVGAVTETTTDLAAGVRDANWIIVCTPVESVVDFVRSAAEQAPAGVILTDVGSTKEAICQGADQALADLPGKFFVGSHPMAGSEKTGPQFGRADLFHKRTVILTPTSASHPAAVKKVTAFWKALGAKTFSMTPAEHDAAVAGISHAPHVIASALAAATPENELPLAAGGFADSTRIAAGDVELWRQILLGNGGRTLQALARFEKVLSDFRAALEANDARRLCELLEAGKRRRDALAS